MLFSPFSMNEEEPEIEEFDLCFVNQNEYSASRHCQYMTEDNFNDKYLGSCVNDLSLFHLNVRSLPRNHAKLKMYLSLLRNNFKFIGVSETWFTEATVHLYNIDGYNQVSVYRTDKRGGGVGLYYS